MFKSITNCILLLGLVSMIGCTKKRPDIESQGSDLGSLSSIAELHGRECNFTTFGGENVKRKILITKSDTQILGNAVQFPVVRNFDKTDCPLINEDNASTFDFRSIRNDAAEPIDHRLKFMIERDHLVIYKIVNASQIANIERSSALVKGKEMFWVPVGGFTISGFYNINYSKNSDNRDTNVKIPIRVKKKNLYNKKGGFTAAYFDIDRDNLIPYAYADRADIVPKSYFDGEWYYSETTMNKSQFTRASVGDYGGAAHNGNNWVSTSVVKFVSDDEKLYAVSTVIDDEAKKVNHLNMPVVLSLSADHVEYRRQVKGAVTTLVEEKVEANNTDKSFYQLNYKSIKSTNQTLSGFRSQLLQFLRSADPRSEVVKVEFEEGYFAVTIELATEGKIKYSFRKKVKGENTYQSKTAYITDLNQFGFFKTRKVKVFDETLSTYGDLEKLYKISRFNPNKDIVYHFSTATPKEDWVRNIGREAVNLWNQAFKKAGMDINIKIKEFEECPADNQFCHDVEVGDIRYNVLNIMDAKYLGRGVGGFGPSLKDPVTGEVIAATTNIYLSLPFFYNTLRGYIRAEAKFTADYSNRYVQDTSYTPGDASLSVSDSIMLSMIDQNAFVVSEDNSYFDIYNINYESMSKTKGKKSGGIGDDGTSYKKSLWSPYRWTDGTQSQVTNDPFENRDGDYVISNLLGLNHKVNLSNMESLQKENLKNFHSHGISAVGDIAGFNTASQKVYKDIGTFVNTLCPKVKEYTATLTKISDKESTEVENEILADCAQLLAQRYFLGVTVHELGHNIGLRHNFKGSMDEDNVVSLSDYEFNYIDIMLIGSANSISSAMDYASFRLLHDEMLVPGLYDIAAIRFGYSDEIELADIDNKKMGTGEFRKIPEGMSIKAYEKSQSVSAKTYEYCTDNAARGTKSDVFCATWDSGTSASEIVKFHADGILSYLEERTLRFDNFSTSSEMEMYSRMLEMKLFYDEWRNIVLTQSGPAAKYLEGYDIASYEDLVKELLSDPKNGKKYGEFLKARNIYVNLLLDISFLPNKYCLVSDINNPESEKAVELSFIRELLTIQDVKTEIISCRNPEVLSYLKSEDLVLKEGDNEIGYFLRGGRYSLVETDASWLRDFSGTLVMRYQAAHMLTSRVTRSYANMKKSFFPTLLDEPDLRYVIKDLLMKRLIDGVHLKSGAIDTDKYSSEARLFDKSDITSRVVTGYDDLPIYQNYSQEKDFLENFFASFILGLNVPGNLNESSSRKADFKVSLTSLAYNRAVLQDPRLKTYQYDDDLVFYTEASNYSYASKMIDLLSVVQTELDKNEDVELTKEEILLEKASLHLTDDLIATTNKAVIESLKSIIDLTPSSEITFADLFLPYQKLSKVVMSELEKYPDNPELALYFRKLVQFYEMVPVGQVGLFQQDAKLPEDVLLKVRILGLNLPENFQELDNFFPGETPVESYIELTQAFKAFLNQRVSYSSIRDILPMLASEEYAEEYLTDIAEGIKRDVLQRKYVFESKQEKISQKGILTKLLFMSR